MSEVCRRNLENIFLAPQSFGLRRETTPIGRQAIKQACSFPTHRTCFEEACKELNIPLFVLSPYSPKKNGRIEAQSSSYTSLLAITNLLLNTV